MRAAVTAEIIACFVESLAFVLLYLRSAWSSTRMGRHLMSLGVVLTLLFGLFLASRLWGPLPPVLWVCGLGALAVVLGWRIKLLIQAQRSS